MARPRLPLHRQLAALCLIGLLAFPLIPVVQAAPANSVQPMQFRGRTFCTAFSINEEKGYWGTARHCAEAAIEKAKGEFTIGGHFAYVVYMDAAWDVAVIVSKLHAPALPLAEKAPNGPVFKNGKLDKPGDLITIIGYPYGLFERNVVIGRITSRMVPIDGYHPSDIYDATVAGGNSGSPVLKDGKIVGILWGSFIQSGHSLGVPWEAVVVALAPYAG